MEKEYKGVSPHTDHVHIGFGKSAGGRISLPDFEKIIGENLEHLDFRYGYRYPKGLEAFVALRPADQDYVKNRPRIEALLRKKVDSSGVLSPEEAAEIASQVVNRNRSQ